MPPEQDVLIAIQTELSGVNATVGAYGERLGKIEDAIITLAATQERVNNIADDLKSRELALQNFQNAIWEEIRRLNKYNSEMLEKVTILSVRSEDNAKKVDTLEKFKNDVNPQIKENTRFRGWGEKLVFIVVTAIVVGVVGTVISFNNSQTLSHRDIAKLLDGRTPVVELEQNNVEKDTK